MAFKYQQLAQLLAEKIASQAMPAGVALPSLRRYAEHQGVSLSTANKTYQWLEQRGLIHAKPKSGYFVRSQYRSPLVSQDMAAVLAQGDSSDLILNVHQNTLRGDLLSFAGGFVAAEFLPVLELQRCLTRAIRRNPTAAYQYGLEQGDTGLRRALCERLAERNCPLLPEQLIITNGCLEAVTLAVQQLTNAGDVVAIFSPCYSGLLLSLKNTDRRILEIPCGPEGPNLEDVEALMAKGAFKALIFSAVGYNPIGFNLSVAAKQRLAAMAARYKVACIEDDAFAELAFHGEESSPVFSYESSYESDGSNHWLYYCGSLSKPLAAGYRIGWIANRGNLAPLLKRKLALNLTCSQPAQVGMADYLFSDGYRAHIGRLKANIERELNRLAAAVQAYFPAGTQLSQPRGGLFLWVKLANNVNSMAFYRAALDIGICIAPGEIFSMAGLGRDCIRLSATEPWSDIREKGIQRLGTLASQLQQ